MDDKKISKKPDFDNITYEYDNICNNSLANMTKDDFNKISIPKKKVSFDIYIVTMYIMIN